jgi:hypothetical protein
MLDLPSEIVVELRSDEANVGNLLIALDVLRSGHYYFGGVIGLTDSRGRISFSRESIENAFEENRREFPMDYRIPLREADPEIDVVVPGGSEFRQAQVTALSSALTSEPSKRIWSLAENHSIESAKARVAMSSSRPVITVTLTLRAAGRSS